MKINGRLKIMMLKIKKLSFCPRQTLCNKIGHKLFINIKELINKSKKMKKRSNNNKVRQKSKSNFIKIGLNKIDISTITFRKNNSKNKKHQDSRRRFRSGLQKRKPKNKHFNYK